MILNVYAIKDVKASFWRPFTHVNDALAVREFTLLINNESSVKDVAMDLELHRIGTYDDATGVIVSAVEYVCSGRDVLKVNFEEKNND